CTLAGPDRICSGTRTPPRGRGGAASLRLVAEMRPGDALLQVLERAKVVDDVPARVVEEDLAVLVAADGDQPLEVVPVLEEIVDGLRHAAPGDDRDLGPRGALRLLRHASLISIRIPPPFQCDTCAERDRSAAPGPAGTPPRSGRRRRARGWP